MEKTIINVRLTNEERETLLNYNYNDDKWTMDTTIVSDFNKACKRGWKVLKEYCYKDGKVVGGLLEAPRNAVSLRSTDFEATN